MALEEIFKVSPDGALVFFPSYKLLDKLCDRWKSTGQWTRLSSVKQLFIGIIRLCWHTVLAIHLSAD